MAMCQVIYLVGGCKTSRSLNSEAVIEQSIRRGIYYYTQHQYDLAIREFEKLHSLGVRNERVPLFYAQALLERSGLDLIDIATEFKEFSNNVKVQVAEPAPQSLQDTVSQFLQNFPGATEDVLSAMSSVETMYQDYISIEGDVAEKSYYESQLFYFRTLEFIAILALEIVYLQEVSTHEDPHEQFKRVLEYFERPGGRALVESLIRIVGSIERLSPKAQKAVAKLTEKIKFKVQLGEMVVQITADDLEPARLQKIFGDHLSKILDQIYPRHLSRLEELGVNREVLEQLVQPRQDAFEPSHLMDGIRKVREQVDAPDEEIGQQVEVKSDKLPQRSHVMRKRNVVDEKIENGDWRELTDVLVDYSKDKS